MTEKVTQPAAQIDPCNSDPCGPFSLCRGQDTFVACSCLPGHIGSPPNCRPECRIHSECASNLVCINNKCRDPCPGACGSNAECEVINHNAVCRCQQGHEGDPFVGCHRVTTREYSMIFLRHVIHFQYEYKPTYVFPSSRVKCSGKVWSILVSRKDKLNIEWKNNCYNYNYCKNVNWICLGTTSTASPTSVTFSTTTISTPTNTATNTMTTKGKLLTLIDRVSER